MSENMQVRYLIDVEYWEYEQALELPYGSPLVRAGESTDANTSDGFDEDA